MRRPKIIIIIILCIILSAVITYNVTSLFYDTKISQITTKLIIDQEKLKISGDELKISGDELKISGDELKKYQISMLESQQEEIKLKTLLFQRNIDARADIVDLLADTVEIQGFAKMAEYSNLNKMIMEDSVKESVKNKLYHFVKSDPDIDHARILDMTGMEVIRINNVDGVLHTIPDSELQNKSSEYYFDEIKKLNQDEIYISNIDLNMEYGEVEIPHKPVLKIATIIYDSNNEKLGILIINYVMKEYISFLTSSPICNIVIFDQNGTIIQHNNKEKMFSFQLGTDYNYYSLHPEFEENEYNGISPYYDEERQHYMIWELTKNYSTERYWHFVCESKI